MNFFVASGKNLTRLSRVNGHLVAFIHSFIQTRGMARVMPRGHQRNELINIHETLICVCVRALFILDFYLVFEATQSLWWTEKIRAEERRWINERTADQLVLNLP